MKDNWGDKVTVALDEDGESVYLSFPDGVNDAAFTAKKARKLAKKLRRAADEIDPRPEIGLDVEWICMDADEPPFEVGDKVLVAEDARWLNGSKVNEWVRGNVVTVIEPVKTENGYTYCWVGESADRGQFVNVEYLTLVAS